MPWSLERRQRTGQLHFITFSCYRRLPLLNTSAAKAIVERALEFARRRYRFQVIGYVAMPEHVHALLSEPEVNVLAAAIQAWKQSVSRRLIGHRKHFWEKRYYDFNGWSDRKRIEKLKYIHRNPVKRGLVTRPEDWEWSSYRHYAFGEEGRVGIDSSWLTGKTPP